MRWLLLAVSFLFIALTPYEYGKLPKVKVLVVYRENLGDLWKFLVEGGDYKVVDLRVGEAFISTELQAKLKDWVNSGGGTVVYMGADDKTDSAIIFFNEEDIEYARLNRWVPVVLRRPKMVDHPLLKGVTKVKLYLHRIPDIKNMQGKTPLLETPDGKVVALAMDYGKGRVVILPTGPLFPPYPVEEYDNQRFFINIYQWLAHNSVPE